MNRVPSPHPKMKYFSITACALSASLFSFSSLAVSNGKPFQELNALIELNAASIEQINQTLSLLGSRVTTLEDSVDAIKSRLDDLELMVIDNHENIALAFEQLSELSDLLAGLNTLLADNIEQTQNNSADIQYLKENQQALIESLESTITEIENELFSLQQDIKYLSEENASLSSELKFQIQTLTDAVENGESNISALESQVIYLAANLTGLNSDYNYLTNLYSQLSEQTSAQQEELDSLKLSLASMGSEDPNTSGTSASFTFTDEPGIDNTDHVDQLRQFLFNNDTFDQWVHVVFTTPAVNKTTELCLQDVIGVFSSAEQLYDHDYQASQQSGGSYRLNNGSWASAGNIKVQTRKDNKFNYVYISATNNDVAIVSAIDIPTVATFHDSYHQKKYFTIDTNQPTIATYTIDTSRLSACGY